jgi:hypothetical protein
MVTPLHLVHLDLASLSKVDILLEDTNWPLTVGQVMVKVNGVMVDFLEGLGLVGDLETFAELGNMEDIMELGQLRG